MLSQALCEMRQKRERAVQAVTERDWSEQLVASTRQHIAELHAKTEIAVANGDLSEVRRLGREVAEYEQYIAIKKQRIEQATRIVEDAKAAIRRGEERVRQKTAEALHLQAEFKRKALWETFGDSGSTIRSQQILITVIAALVLLFILLFLLIR